MCLKPEVNYKEPFAEFEEQEKRDALGKGLFGLMKNDNLNLAKSLKTLLAQLQGSIDGDFSKYAYMSIEDALADAFKELERLDGKEVVPFSGQ